MFLKHTNPLKLQEEVLKQTAHLMRSQSGLVTVHRPGGFADVLTKKLACGLFSRLVKLLVFSCINVECLAFINA